jgi:hypothetical protein
MVVHTRSVPASEILEHPHLSLSAKDYVDKPIAESVRSFVNGLVPLIRQKVLEEALAKLGGAPKQTATQNTATLIESPPGHFRLTTADNKSWHRARKRDLLAIARKRGLKVVG